MARTSKRGSNDLAGISGSLCLVTGGAGFIGSHLVDGLLRYGAQVRVVDSLVTGYEANISHCRSGIQFIQGDLADIEVSRAAAAGADYVFHLAAIPSVPRSIDNPEETNRSNVVATLNLAVACSRAKVKRLVFASTCAVYGDAPSLPVAEDAHPQPMSPYALSKWMGEQYLDMCRRTYGLQAVCLRYFNVFGPRQDPGSPYSGVISKFLSTVQSGSCPVIFGDGAQTRDFVYVDNVVRANLLAGLAERAAGQIINIGTGKRTSLHGVLKSLARISGAKITPEHQPPRAGDIRHSVASIKRARRLLGYEVQVSFEDGLRRTLEWFSGNAVK